MTNLRQVEQALLEMQEKLIEMVSFVTKERELQEERERQIFEESISCQCSYCLGYDDYNDYEQSNDPVYNHFCDQRQRNEEEMEHMFESNPFHSTSWECILNKHAYWETRNLGKTVLKSMKEKIEIEEENKAFSEIWLRRISA